MCGKLCRNLSGVANCANLALALFTILRKTQQYGECIFIKVIIYTRTCRMGSAGSVWLGLQYRNSAFNWYRNGQTAKFYYNEKLRRQADEVEP